VHWAPGIPHALFGADDVQNPDASRRGNAEVCLDYDYTAVVAYWEPVIPGRCKASNYDVRLHIGESRDSPMCNCTSWFAPMRAPRNDVRSAFARLRAKSNLSKRIKLIWVVQSCRKKYSASHVGQITLTSSPRLIRMRGGSRSSRTLRWDAVDAERATDERSRGGRRRRVVLAPRRWCQVPEKQSFPGATAARKPFAGKSTL